MDKIIRCITSDGAVMASAIDASDIVFKAQKTVDRKFTDFQEALLRHSADFCVRLL